MKCSQCGQIAEGAFCASCGAPQAGASCGSCRKPLVAGARFCTACGTPVRAGGGSNLPWYVAGASLVTLILVLLLPTLRPAPPGIEFQRAVPGAGAAPFAGSAAAAGAGGMQAPPLTGTLREQADRLFNRIMEARAQGDTAQATFFMPMGLTAYREAGALDDDGLYHLAVLESAAGEHAAARATAERILARSPDHLLGLGVAGESAAMLGDTEGATAYYRRLLDRYESESNRQLPEYIDHNRILPTYREAAERHLGR
jgi:hypothetical protein